jgi:hypothetical protein
VSQPVNVKPCPTTTTTRTAHCPDRTLLVPRCPYSAGENKGGVLCERFAKPSSAGLLHLWVRALCEQQLAEAPAKPSLNRHGVRPQSRHAMSSSSAMANEYGCQLLAWWPAERVRSARWPACDSNITGPQCAPHRTDALSSSCCVLLGTALAQNVQQQPRSLPWWKEKKNLCRELLQMTSRTLLACFGMCADHRAGQ